MQVDIYDLSRHLGYAEKRLKNAKISAQNKKILREFIDHIMDKLMKDPEFKQMMMDKLAKM